MGCGSSTKDGIEGIEDNIEAGDVLSFRSEAKHEDKKYEKFSPPLPGTIEESDNPLDRGHQS